MLGKYRRAVITEEVDTEQREMCLGIVARYEIEFLEIGTERERVHFLVQRVPKYSPEQKVRTIKSRTARKTLERYAEEKKQLWGRVMWTRGYYEGSVGEHGEEQVIQQ
jgi:REP element-mobilizing transposase RayT